jgi:transcriptional regulator with XRE-family HTH domain
MGEVSSSLKGLARPSTSELKQGALSRLLTMSTIWNGLNASATNMVEALAHLTERSDLQFLTLLPFSALFSHKKLLRRNKAWCSRCFETWYQAQSPIYEPLLWCLESVSLCHLHGQYLQSCCPYPDCGRVSPPLAARSQPGYCPWCQRWLGAPFHWMGSIPSYWANEEWRQQHWIAQTVGEVLTQAKSLSLLPQRENAVCILSAYVFETMQGRRAQAARQLGLTASTLQQWLTGKKKPQMRNLLQVCSSLDISLLALLDGTAHLSGESRFSKWELPASEPPRRPFRRFHPETLKLALLEAVNHPANPPLSLTKLAQQLGYRSSFLSLHFPELCQAISSDYQAYQANRREQLFQQRWEEVHQAILSLHAQGLYPGETRIRKLLKVPSSLRLPAIRRAWKATLREMGFI